MTDHIATKKAACNNAGGFLDLSRHDGRSQLLLRPAVDVLVVFGQVVQKFLDVQIFHGYESSGGSSSVTFQF